MVASDYALKCEWNYLPMRERDVQGDGFSVAELKKAAERNKENPCLKKKKKACHPMSAKDILRHPASTQTALEWRPLSQ